MHKMVVKSARLKESTPMYHTATTTRKPGQICGLMLDFVKSCMDLIIKPIHLC